MTPAERIAEMRRLWAVRDIGPLMKHSDDGYFDRLLALAEAVPARLATSHDVECRAWVECDEDKPLHACTCGHDALAAAWAALGDG